LDRGAELAQRRPLPGRVGELFDCVEFIGPHPAHLRAPLAHKLRRGGSLLGVRRKRSLASPKAAVRSTRYGRERAGCKTPEVPRGEPHGVNLQRRPRPAQGPKVAVPSAVCRCCYRYNARQWRILAVLCRSPVPVTPWRKGMPEK
jgi:hypothetical protein